MGTYHRRSVENVQTGYPPDWRFEIDSRVGGCIISVSCTDRKEAIPMASKPSTIGKISPYLEALMRRYNIIDDTVTRAHARPYFCGTELRQLKRRRLQLKEQIRAMRQAA